MGGPLGPMGPMGGLWGAGHIPPAKMGWGKNTSIFATKRNPTHESTYTFTCTHAFFTVLLADVTRQCPVLQGRGQDPPETPNSNQQKPVGQDHGQGRRADQGHGPTYLIAVGWLTHVKPTATLVLVRPPRIPSGREASHDALKKSLPSKGRLPYKPNAHAPTGKQVATVNGVATTGLAPEDTSGLP